MTLVQQSESAVKKELESLVKYVRSRNYNLPRDYDFLFELGKEICNYFKEGNKPLIEALKDVIKVDLQNNLVADFCCGSGKRTLRLVKELPQAEIYGFDILLPFIKKAQKRAKGNPRIHFSQADVYNFNNSCKFDIVTFHKSCGALSDKVMQYATNNEVKTICGRFCCYHTIPSTMPRSKGTIQNVYLKLNESIYQFIRNKFAENFVTAPSNMDRDLLSNFAQNELGITEKELEKIAATSVDSKPGAKIVDLNRILKLFERKYSVRFDEQRHIVLAIKN